MGSAFVQQSGNGAASCPRNGKSQFSRLTPLTFKEIKRALEGLGYEQKKEKGGSHIVFYNPNTRKSTTVPYHSTKDLGLRILSLIIAEVGQPKELFWLLAKGYVKPNSGKFNSYLPAQGI